MPTNPDADLKNMGDASKGIDFEVTSLLIYSGVVFFGRLWLSALHH